MQLYSHFFLVLCPATSQVNYFAFCLITQMVLQKCKLEVVHVNGCDQSVFVVQLKIVLARPSFIFVPHSDFRAWKWYATKL